MADFLDILISRYTFLTTAEKCLLRDFCKDTGSLLEKNPDDISLITGRRHHPRGWNVKKAVSEAENAFDALAEGRIKCVCFDEAGYPPQLAEIFDPPFILYYRGELPDWTEPLVAVVGTRIPSGNGLDVAFELGYELGRLGIRVVSGLAAGIDGAAHAGNTAGGAGSIGILGCGPDRIYPKSNNRTASAMLQYGGAVISEYPPGTEPRRHHFPQRNRIISGLSRSVVVVEAPGKSGALITADFALEQGRDLFIHSAAISGSGRCGRVERLLFDGAPIISGAGDIFANWGFRCENSFLPVELREPVLNSGNIAEFMAARMSEELKGETLKFNGKYFRRACYESSYSINS